MCDSPVMLSQSDSTSKILYSKVIYGNSKTQLDLADEESTSSSLEANNVNEEAGSFASCIRSSNPYPYRIQLEQDVWRLQQQLQEEMEMHAILENAIEKNTVKLSCPSCLPRHFEQAQELLSTIAVMEVTVSKLEQEIVSLHFQLSQERNERRLAEYRLRQSASQSLSAYSFDSMKEEISSSSRSLKHSDCEQHQSEKNNSHKHQTSESTGETSSAQIQ
uniref:Ternary complex factor MIP1 leucine-zipper domain-containing protein n=1 Tax=Salix viminalis TaxID=40686 RepID=A0A6N2LBE5_SALVM